MHKILVTYATRAGSTFEVAEQVAEVLKALGETGAEVMEFHLHRPNLQDAFIALTGHALRDRE